MAVIFAVLVHAVVVVVRDDLIGAHDTRQAEVSDLDRAVRARDQDIGRLEVAVNDVGLVDVAHAVYELVEDVLDVLLCEVLVGLKDLREICVNELEDEVDVA
mmetsp:Transcript_18337/g.19932  ORF Transcript_18337/g.19932 Transcript_18337/m.19932 type:complete len:102 (+) Transcript_18337:988-1293(+)